MGRLIIFWLWLTRALAASESNGRRTGDNVRNLEGDAGPGAQTLTASVNRDESTSNLKFGDMWILPDYRCSEEMGVKLCGSP